MKEYVPTTESFPFKVFLGKTKHWSPHNELIFLEGFKWDCGWYWDGGGISSRSMWCYFNGCFLDVPDIRGHPLGNFVTPWSPKQEYVTNPVVVSNGCSVWEDITFFLDDVPEYLTGKRWWRIKDLYKQFYIYQKAAESFKHGGNCTSDGRVLSEIVPEMANAINHHIEHVIIPLIINEVNPASK